MKAFKTLIICFLAFVLGQLTDAYNIGIGKSDITGPAAEIVMMGFADSSETTAGILNRQYARAFQIEDPDTNSRIMFVHCDLMAVMQLVHQEVLAQLATKYDGLFTEQNVILHATHTHAGPGGTAGYTLYDISIFGFVGENFDKVVSGIVAAIDAAHNSVESGTIRWNKGEVTKGGNNRSPKAYLANPASERAPYPSNIDTTMRALHFFNDAGKLRGVLAFYPVHPNSLKGKNHLISGDNKGYAEFLLEDELDDDVVQHSSMHKRTLKGLTGELRYLRHPNRPHLPCGSRPFALLGALQMRKSWTAHVRLTGRVAVQTATTCMLSSELDLWAPSHSGMRVYTRSTMVEGTWGVA